MRLTPLLWIISFAISAVIIFMLVARIRDHSLTYLADASQLSTQEKADAYLKDNWLAEKGPKNNETFFVPTGVFIESLNFADASSVNISGYVWQKFAGRAREKVSRGFVLPDASQLFKEEAYVRHEEGTDIVGWYFEAKITHGFDYSRFPFDHKRVWLRLWHKDFDSNVILVPDLESYDSTRPYDKFGLDESIVLAGYSVEETFFNYRLSSYDTNFGLKKYIGQKNFPELYFNVELKRNIMDALVIHLLPLIAIFMLAFIALISTSIIEERRKFFGANFLSILQVCAALLFMVLLAHIRLRELFSGLDVIYLENMHLITYIALVYVSLNAYATTRKMYLGGNSIIAFADNLIPKILFFPFFLSMMLVVTYINFQ